MQKLHTILVPTDFSEHSEHALFYAASLGERFGATVHLLHVRTLHGLEGKPSEEDFPDMTELLTRADQIAREWLDAGAAHGGAAEVAVVKALTQSINAYEAIVGYATRKSADMIIIATRGNTGLKHVLLGSVTERVVRFTPCPVLVVEKGDRDFVDPGSGKVDISRVVVADDFSEGPERATKLAVEFLAPYQPQIHLIHAVENEVPPIYQLAGVDSAFQLNPDLKDKLCSLLEGRSQSMIPEGWQSVCEIREGKPYKVVTDYAAEVKADLLIVAQESEIDLEERILGGTTERIVRHAPCPTLVL